MLGVTSPGRGLGQLTDHERAVRDRVLLEHLQRGVLRGLVPAEAVVQQGVRVRGDRGHPALLLGARLADHRVDQHRRRGLVAAQHLELHRADPEDPVPGRGSDLPFLLDVRGGGGQVTGHRHHVGPEVQRPLELDEGAAVARDPFVPGGQFERGVEVPQIERDDPARPVAGEPQPAPHVLGVAGARQIDGLDQLRSGRGVPAGEADRQSLQQQVARRRPPRPGSSSPAHDARRGGPDRSRGPSRSPARDGRPAAAEGSPTGTPPTVRAGAGTGCAART